MSGLSGHLVPQLAFDPAGRLRNVSVPAMNRPVSPGVARLSRLLTLAYLAHVTAHILLPPVLFLLPGLRLGGFSEPGHHRLLIVALLSASAVILGAGWYRHKDAVVLWWGGSGGVCMLIAAWAVSAFGLGHHTGVAVGTAGSLSLAAAHWRNHRFWRGYRRLR